MRPTYHAKRSPHFGPHSLTTWDRRTALLESNARADVFDYRTLAYDAPKGDVLRNLRAFLLRLTRQRTA